MNNTGDLGSLLSSILSDPSAMDQVLHTAEALGFDAAAGGSSPSPPPDDSAPDEGADITGILLRMLPLISTLGNEDDSTRLLSALRPFLSKEKAKRVDEAKKLLTLLRVLSALRDTFGKEQ